LNAICQVICIKKCDGSDLNGIVPGDLQKTNCDGLDLNGIWQVIYKKIAFMIQT